MLKGFKHSDESKKKMSIIKKGKPFSEEHKKKLSDSHKGKYVSIETRQKHSELFKGNKYALGKHHSEETKKKISEYLKGRSSPMKDKHHSDETKKKIGIANKGKYISEETKKKISIINKGSVPWNKGMKGNHLSEEHKKKISVANKGENNSFYGKHHSEEAKKKMLSKIINKGSSIEVLGQESLAKRGYTFLCNIPTENISVPDQILPDYKIAVFEDGCYFHACINCGYENSKRVSKRMGKTTIFKDGRIKELENDKILKSLGWTVIRIWEHEIKQDTDIVGKTVDIHLIKNQIIKPKLLSVYEKR